MNIPPGLKPYFKAITALGILALIGDTMLSTMFGFTISPIMGPILAVISLASGLLLVVALFFHRIGWKALSNGLVAAWVACFLFNAWSNMGVATSNRMSEVQTAGVQKATYTERQKETEEAEARLKLFTGQLETLLSQNAWAATVTADGLRAQVADLRVSRESEAKLGGCGRKCRGIENQIAEVSGQIAVAEQRQDLTKRIEATKAVLEKARNQLASTDAGISNTANQSALYAKLISWNLAADPSAAAVTVANEGTGIATAIILALIAAALTLVGAWPHLMEATPMSVMPQPRRPVAPSDWAKPAETVQNTVSNGVHDAQQAILDRLAALQGAARDVNLRVVHEPLRERMLRLGVA